MTPTTKQEIAASAVRMLHEVASTSIARSRSTKKTSSEPRAWAHCSFVRIAKGRRAMGPAAACLPPRTGSAAPVAMVQSRRVG
jgi:hypothetical protein